MRCFSHLGKGFHLITTAQLLLRFYYESVMNASRICQIRVARSFLSASVRPSVRAHSAAGFLPQGDLADRHRAVG